MQQSREVAERGGAGREGEDCANETLKLADAELARSLNEIAKFLCLFYAQGKLKKAQKRAKETEENRRKRKTMMLQLAGGQEREGG